MDEGPNSAIFPHASKTLLIFFHKKISILYTEGIEIISIHSVHFTTMQLANQWDQFNLKSQKH